MAAQALVTVCVPTVGRTPLLRETLRSLDLQTYSNLEVVILDNASPPDTQDFLRCYMRENGGARILRSDQQIPMFANFNRGIRAATGEYVVFFHDDDFYRPTFIADEAAMLRDHPSVGFVGSNYDLIDETGRVIRHRTLIDRTGVVPGRHFIADLVKRGRSIMPTPGILYRREAIETFEFDESLHILFGDFVMLARMAETWDVGIIAEPLMHIRLHNQQGTASLPLSQAIPLRTGMMRDYCAEFLTRWPDQGAFIHSLERRLDRSQRIGLLWGWASAPNGHEAEACLRGLGKSLKDVIVVGLLRRLDRLGLTPNRRRAFVAPLLRRLGDAAGV